MLTRRSAGSQLLKRDASLHNLELVFDCMLASRARRDRTVGSARHLPIPFPQLLPPARTRTRTRTHARTQS